MAIDKNKTMVVPDAIHHTDTSETLEYIQGWNDCRATMLAEQPAQQKQKQKIVEHLLAVADHFYDGPVRNLSVVDACEKAINKISAKEIYKTSIYKAETDVANNSKVICPVCTHQFRAIPVDVQKLMLDAGFVPPFTSPQPAQRTWVGLTDGEKSEMVFALFSDGKAASKSMYLLNVHEAKLKEKNT